ncbi:MAG: pirin family protein [Deltaproteobacteria bacterium]|nr:pirin family protein [Deltaproteobacteria bacterium]
MITIREGSQRGHFNHGWLDTYHTFSFGEYMDRDHIQFRALRVMNEDRIAPKTGFPNHPHQDMEILTYPLSGRLTHQDSMGHRQEVSHGQVQYMSAGTGVFHSEANESDQEVHLYQIWILPDLSGHPPQYGQRDFPVLRQPGQWIPIATPDGAQDSIRIHQDASLLAAVVPSGGTLTWRFAPGRYGWLQVARGRVSLNGQLLEAGDGAALTHEPDMELNAPTEAEVLLFDLG